MKKGLTIRRKDWTVQPHICPHCKPTVVARHKSADLSTPLTVGEPVLIQRADGDWIMGLARDGDVAGKPQTE
jgi:hypothetical protein